MQLNVTTDYAIRIMLCLCKKETVVSAREISETMKIPEDYVLKITKRLLKSGLIKSYIGKNGGFSASASPKTITLLMIIQAVENTVKINRCLEEDKFCNRLATEICPVRNFYCRLQNELETSLSSITIKTLLEEANKIRED